MRPLDSIKFNPLALEVMNKLGAPGPVNFDPENNSDHLLELMGALEMNVFFLENSAYAIPGEDFGGEEFETRVDIGMGPNAKSAAMKKAIFRLLESINPTLL